MTLVASTRHERHDTASAAFANVCRDGVQWTVRSDVSNEVLSENGLPIEHWLADGAATVIKSGRHRTVYRLQLPSGGYFLKHYRVPDWKSLLQNVVRPSKAELEWRAIERIREAGIPTVVPVALGLRKRGPIVTDSFLITEAITDVETLQEFVERHAAQRQSVSGKTRRQLAEQLGRMVARLHTQRLLHRDLHAGNLLVCVDPQDAARLWLIDLHAVVQRKRLTPAQMAETHALLHNFLARHTTPADRLRYFQSWWHDLPEQSVADREMLRITQTACERWSALACEKADRKWLLGHRKLHIIEADGTQCRGVAALGGDVIRELVTAVNRETHGNTRTAEALAKSWQTLLVERGIADESQIEIRIHNDNSAGKRKVCWLGRERFWSDARMTWEFGHALRRRGIATPEPRLFAEQQTNDGRVDVLVTASDVACPVDTADCRHGVIHRAAKLLRCLHDHGLLHTRLSPRCFACEPGRDDVLLTDIAAVNPAANISREQIIAQLVQLHDSRAAGQVSLTQRLRFLLSYLDRPQRPQWKTWWRDVQNASQRNNPDVDDNNPRSSRRRFLRAALASAALFLGCRTPNRQQVLTRPARHSIRSGQLLVLSNFKLPRDHDVIQDLVRVRKTVTVALDLPTATQREDVVVYIFTTEKEYRDYLNSVYPGLPDRRAYFVGTKDELAVYTYWGDRIQEDLRHEYTHGLLHASLKFVPLWIDEGLAEYFEVGGPRPGMANSDYAQRLAVSASNGWKPDMKELEKLEEFSRMQHIHYQEAWAWVHYLLHHSDGTRQLLLDYLKDLRTSRNPQPLSERLQRFQPGYQDRLLAHLATLQSPGLLTERYVKPAGRFENEPVFPPR